jgi:hypothetical protein
MHKYHFLIAVSALLLISWSRGLGQNTNQNPSASGGRTSDSAAPTKPTPKANPPAAKPSKPRVTSTAPKSTAQSSGAMDTVSGKWWTTGNDFDTSELLLEQNGNLISGAIMYADGRTGTFSGVLSNKKINFTWTNTAGDSGTGWFEHSWNNFLGGSYRNRAGATGSWTLSRIAGNWCFGGSRDRIRKVNHGSKGQLFFVTEDGGEEAGHLEGPFIYLHGDGGDVKGTLNYKSNRVDFATGTFWTWCGR